MSGINGNMNGDTQRLRTCHSPGVFPGSCTGCSCHLPMHGNIRFFSTPSPARHRRRLCLNGWNGHQVHSAMATRYIAGYHWFCEPWGRDSAISVTGLLIERGLKDESRAVLKRLSDMSRDGVIPNRFPDNYHTSDASLWFIHALARYRRRWGMIPSWRR